MRRTLTSFPLCLAGIIAALVVSSCKQEVAQPPAPTVTVAHPFSQEVTEWDEYAGRLEAKEVASIASRVSGIIVDAPFREGALVAKGDTLFVIDPRPFQAELASKEAELSRARAQFAQAQANYSRYDKIKNSPAIAASDFDQALASLKQAQAAIAGAEAERDLAALNLEWTKVTSPIDGAVGRKLVTVGNLVTMGTGQGTPLTTVTSITPMYAFINVPERLFLRYQKLSVGADAGINTLSLPCEFRLENESEYRKDCVVDFFDNHIANDTGTITLRAVVPNLTGSLKAGSFVRMRIVGSEKHTSLLVPDIAIVNDQNSRAVLVVNQNDTVEMRAVTLGALFGTNRAIVSGVSADDRVVVAGVQYARPGTKVNPTEAGQASSAAVSSPVTTQAR